MLNSYAIVYPRKLGLRIDHLWLVGVLATFSVIVSLMPLYPNDFWWHLKMGEIIYTTGKVPATNMFGWTLALEHPFTYGAWLAEYLFYLLYLLGGVSMIVFTRTFMTVAAFFLVGVEAQRRSGSWRIAGFVVMLACAMASNNTVVRPQIFAWLPFMGFYLLLSAYVDGQVRGRWLLALPVMMAFWVNVHGTYVLGPVMLGIFFAGESFRTWRKMEGALPWQDVAWIAVIGVLVTAAILINPTGFGIFGYVVNMMTDKPSQTLIVEWQSPAPNSYPTILFFVSILVMLAVFAYSRYRPTPTELLLLLGFLWLAWSGVRYIVWFGMVAMPILARAIKDLVEDKPWMYVPQRNMLNLVLAVVLFLPAFIFQPWFVHSLPMPEGYWKYVLKDAEEVGPLLHVNTPVEAAEYLRAHPGGKLFNEMSFGSYLIWAVPEQKVFVDPRVELYPFEQWIDYLKITEGNRYNELLSQYGADRIMISIEEQDTLSELLHDDPLWALEYSDDYTELWSKVH